MKVSLDISPVYTVPYAVIYADDVTEEIHRAVDMLTDDNAPITALENEKNLVILQPQDIYMIRIENGDTVIYGENKSYRSRKRLYELSDKLGNRFMQISKTTLINLSYMDVIEPGFGGTVLLKLKNGCKDYVSRRYLPHLKEYLGLKGGYKK